MELFGVSGSLSNQTSLSKNGRTVESNFHDFQIAQIDETPPIEVYIVNTSPKELGGTGEVGPVTVVPAIANAIFRGDRKALSIVAAWSSRLETGVSAEHASIRRFAARLRFPISDLSPSYSSTGG